MNLTALQSLYEFETPVEQAFALLVAGAEMKCYTPSNASLLTDEFKAANPALAENLLVQDFQKERPRVEIEFQMGAAQGISYPEIDFPAVGGYLYELAHAFTLQVVCVTAAETVVHRQHVAAVRVLLATALRSINGITLPNHRIEELTSQGGAPQYKPEEGNYVSILTYSGQIAIQNDILAAALAG